MRNEVVLASYLFGFGSLFALWILYRTFTGTWSFWRLIEGADRRASSSKLQFFLWTVVGIFAYVCIYSFRVRHGSCVAVDFVPLNLMVAMGMSLVTATVSKAVTVSYVDLGKVVKPAGGGMSPGQVVQDDSGFPDLSKIQMLAWTAIAIVAYLINLGCTLADAVGPGRRLPELPDIDAALMVLMGLGQGAFVGKKLVTTTTPRLVGITPGSGPAGTEVTVTGAALGDNVGSLILLDGVPMDAPPAAWSDTEIKFAISPKRPDGKDWQAGQVIRIGVITGGRESVNRLPFTVTAK